MYIYIYILNIKHEYGTIEQKYMNLKYVTIIIIVKIIKYDYIISLII